MLQARELSYQRDLLEVKLLRSFNHLPGSILTTLFYLLRPEDTSAPIVPPHYRNYINRGSSSLATAKLIFWFTAAISLTILLSKLA